jgi:hypothetical protein
MMIDKHIAEWKLPLALLECLLKLSARASLNETYDR